MVINRQGSTYKFGHRFRRFKLFKYKFRNLLRNSQQVVIFGIMSRFGVISISISEKVLTDELNFISDAVVDENLSTNHHNAVRFNKNIHEKLEHIVMSVPNFL